MSVFDARDRLEQLGDPSGYCMPLSIDSAMHHAKLPDKYYDLFKEAYDQGSSFSKCMTTLLEGFFRVDARNETEAPVACFSAFSGSPQSYFPDVPYDFEEELRDPGYENTGITSKNFRIREIIKTATEKRCNILFHTPANDTDHVNNLQLIDPRSSGYIAYYLVRNNVEVVNTQLCDSNVLSGMDHLLGLASEDGPQPIPEVHKHWFPEGQTSASLIILPPEPSLQ